MVLRRQLPKRCTRWCLTSARACQASRMSGLLWSICDILPLKTKKSRRISIILCLALLSFSRVPNAISETTKMIIIRGIVLNNCTFVTNSVNWNMALTWRNCGKSTAPRWAAIFSYTTEIVMLWSSICKEEQHLSKYVAVREEIWIQTNLLMTNLNGNAPEWLLRDLSKIWRGNAKPNCNCNFSTANKTRVDPKSSLVPMVNQWLKWWHRVKLNARKIVLTWQPIWHLHLVLQEWF